MFNLVSLIKTAGYLGVAAIVFAESGLFIGFFLPGDTLLFTTGFLASQHFFNIWLLLPLLLLAAVAGDQVGYIFGKRIGPKIFSREDSFFFHKSHLRKAQEFFAKHGSKAVVLARFMPIVRTFIPILAGVGNMRYSTFVLFNIIGGTLWSGGLLLVGFYLGGVIPNVDRYFIPIIALIIFISILPGIIHFLKEKKRRQWLAALFQLQKKG